MSAVDKLYEALTDPGYPLVLGGEAHPRLQGVGGAPAPHPLIMDAIRELIERVRALETGARLERAQ